MSSPWDKFRNLCRYYADCVKYSEKSQEYLFPDQLGKSFMMPCLPLGWHLRDEAFDIPTSREDAFVRSSLLGASDSGELFIGYPLDAFRSPDGVECLCPVMLFPVSISVLGEGYTTGLRLSIDRQGISLNQDWVEYHVPKCDQKAFQSACEQSNDELGCVDVELVLSYVAAHFKTKMVSPDSMSFAVRRSQAENGLLNTAVLFQGSKTQYSKNLLSELKRIAAEPDAVLDKTALAYVFRDPPLPNEMLTREPKRIPVSFTSRRMNAGQFNAVEEALNTPLTKVTGPPGTGKSFMSVNLIANEVLHGGSVLFTSRNHKAIHAIYDKTPDAVADKDFPLISFCTAPDNPTYADWRNSQKDVDDRIAKIAVRNSSGRSLPVKAGDDALCQAGFAALDVALSAYRDAEGLIDRYRNLRGRISSCEQALARLDALVSGVPPAKRDAPETLELLEDIGEILDAEPSQSLRSRIARLLARLLRRKSAEPDWRSLLADFAPSLASPVVSRKTARKEVRRLLGLLKYRALAKSWENAELQAMRLAESDTDYETLKSAVCAALSDAGEHVQSAYIERLAARVAKVADSESLVAKCGDLAKAAMAHVPLDFLVSVDNGERYDEPVAAFREFLDILPAWAATMLSLHRASPCLPSVFSLAIIDEASQCDIPPMIPVLFRAERVAIVGDENQFPPVITLSPKRDAALLKRYKLDGHDFRKFTFREGNAYSVAPAKPLLLDEHFRCADGIAAYFNEEFYNGGLILCNEDGRDIGGGRGGEVSAAGRLRPGMEFVDAPGGDAAEIEAALEYLRGLKSNCYSGSIGVISPLRDLANRFKTAAAQNKATMPPQLDIQTQISTANGFQGAECDVILFLIGLNGDRARGEEWYVTAPENKYIYNVSVSRAKHLFVAFGDRNRVMQSGLRYIERLVPENRPPLKPDVGPGEGKLKIALQRAGIETEAQYPVYGRYLDLAIPKLKIDIEVDGQAWHLDRNGGRKADDIHRDAMLEATGWRVVRVWHLEVVNDIDGCIAKVKAIIDR